MKMWKNKINFRIFSVPLGLFVSLVLCLSLLLVAGGSLPASAQGSTLYGAAYQGPDGPATLYTVNTSTGEATEVGPIGFERCGGMDFDASGTLYATAERADGSDIPVLITIDPETGAGTEVGVIGLECGWHCPFYDVSFRNSDGVLFACFGINESVGIATIDTQTGAGVFVGPTLTCEPGNAIAFSSGDTLYHADSELYSLHTLDHTTGEAITFVPLNFPPGYFDGIPVVNAMDFEPDSGILFATVKDMMTPGGGPGQPKYLATIDTDTGDVTIIGLTEKDLDAIAFFVPPEPGEAIVGGTVAGENWLEILAPWLALAAAIIAGGIILMRRRAQS